MEHTRPDMSPEELLESITSEALSALALGTPSNIRDIEPLEAVLPLIAKGWGLPEEVLANRTGRLEQGKKLAAENKGGLPGEKLLECYDGHMITALLWALLRTAVRLDTQEERQTICSAALLLDEGLNLQSFLIRGGTCFVKMFWRDFCIIVQKEDPAVREYAGRRVGLWPICMHMASLRPRETRAETQERSRLGHYTGPGFFMVSRCPFLRKLV